MANAMWTIGVLLVIGMVTHISGHGDMVVPPSRGLLGGYHTPWGVNCGGLWAQTSNNGQCGPCGDAITQAQPRDFEEGGKYDSGQIGATYTEGETINVVVRITANHKGNFDFKLCPSADVTRRTTQLEDCLAANPLQIIDTKTGIKSDKWPLSTSDGTGEITHLQVVLPTGVTCAHCVMRWAWIGGNNCCGNPQEEFRNCMDIRIQGNPNATQAPITPAPTPGPTAAPTPAPTAAPAVTSCPSNSVLECMPVPPLPSISSMEDWCNEQCRAKSSECTGDRCNCRCEKRQVDCTFVHPRYSNLISNGDDWCDAMCGNRACSKAHCNCVYY